MLEKDRIKQNKRQNKTEWLLHDDQLLTSNSKISVLRSWQCNEMLCGYFCPLVLKNDIVFFKKCPISKDLTNNGEIERFRLKYWTTQCMYEQKDSLTSGRT